MPDPDRNAAEPMDAPGTRVTPEPDEHPGHDARPTRDALGGDPDAFAGRGRAGDTGAAAPAGIGIGADDRALAAAPANDADPSPDAGVDDTTATDGGTGTSGARGGGPAADFRNEKV